MDILQVSSRQQPKAKLKVYISIGMRMLTYEMGLFATKAANLHFLLILWSGATFNRRKFDGREFWGNLGRQHDEHDIKRLFILSFEDKLLHLINPLCASISKSPDCDSAYLHCDRPVKGNTWLRAFTQVLYLEYNFRYATFTLLDYVLLHYM